MIDLISSIPSSLPISSGASLAPPATEQELMSHFDSVLADLLKIGAEAESAIAKMGDQLQKLSTQEASPDSPTTRAEGQIMQAPQEAHANTSGAASAPAVGNSVQSDSSATLSSGASQFASDANIATDAGTDRVSQFFNSLQASQAYDSARQVIAMASGLFTKSA